VALATTLVAAGCVAEPTPPAPAVRHDAIASRPVPVRASVESVRPLDHHVMTTPPVHGRNPFTFGSGMTATRLDPKKLPPLPPPEGLPELPLPPVGPQVRLLGIVTGRETPPVRTAVLSVGPDLVLARVGDVVAVRYKVEAVTEDSVSLVDATAQEHLRLPLK
jgi:hypothetical protein